MSIDFYRQRLMSAAWDWMERRTWFKRGVSRNRKDRRDGRAEKRGARNEERRERAAEET